MKELQTVKDKLELIQELDSYETEGVTATGKFHEYAGEAIEAISKYNDRMCSAELEIKVAKALACLHTDDYEDFIYDAKAAIAAVKG